jgi:hypothetical protein
VCGGAWGERERVLPDLRLSRRDFMVMAMQSISRDS